ncbi:MAG TPA: hypothetical protein VM076_08460, partial [Gemmatimonadaceae bacterium]|nr:hypothetical protein [Gemmatimonadaceae bacterium]
CAACASELADLAKYARRPQSRPWRWLAVAAAVVLIVVAAIAKWGHTPPATVTPKVRIARTVPTSTPTATVAPDPLQSLDPELRKVAEQLQAGTIASARLLASLHRAPEQQRGASEKDAVRVTEPVGVVVESARPTFRWTPAAEVVVQVFDDDYALVVESPRFTGTSWRPPTPLPRGRTYRWQLVLHDDSIAPAPPAPPALVHVLSAKAFAELSKARASDATLEAGLICVREGLLEDAARLLAQYATEHPSDVAERLAKNAR